MRDQKIALVLPAAGSINLGNEMICGATRTILHRLPNQFEIEEFTFLWRPSSEELERINQCDKAIFVGTNIFQSHAAGWRWKSRDLEQVAVPYWLYGVGYSGPIQNDTPRVCKETKELVDWSRKAAGLGVRDPHTLRWLMGFRVRSELIGCPVLAYTDTFSDISSGEGEPVIAVRQLLLHNPSKKVASAQCAMVEWFFREYPNGIGVVQETADLNLLKGRSTVRDLDRIVKALSEASFVLSTRLHTGMIALALGRPVVFLAHDTRVASFCEMMSLSSRRLNPEGIKEATVSINRIEQGDLAEFSPTISRIRYFRRRLEDFLAGAITQATYVDRTKTSMNKRGSRMKGYLNKLLGGP